MRSEIEWLIERYTEKLEEIKADYKIYGGQFRAGMMQVYEKIVQDLLIVIGSENEKS